MFSNKRKRNLRTMGALLGVLSGAPVGLNLASVPANAARRSFEDAADTAQNARRNISEFDAAELLSLLEYCRWTVSTTVDASKPVGNGDNREVLNAMVKGLKGPVWNGSVAWVKANVKSTGAVGVSPFATVLSEGEERPTWNEIMGQLKTVVGQDQVIEGVNGEEKPVDGQNLIYHVGGGHWKVHNRAAEAYQLALAYAAVTYDDNKGATVPSDLELKKWSLTSDLETLTPKCMGEDRLFAIGPGFIGYILKNNDADATLVSCLRGNGVDPNGGFGDKKNATIYVNRENIKPLNAVEAFKRVLNNTHHVADNICQALTGHDLDHLTEVDINSINDEKLDGARRLVQALKGDIVKNVCEGIGVVKKDDGDEDDKKFATNTKLSAPLGAFARLDPKVLECGFVENEELGDNVFYALIDCASGSNLPGTDINETKENLKSLLGTWKKTKTKVYLTANAPEDFRKEAEDKLVAWAEGTGTSWLELKQNSKREGVEDEQAAAKKAIKSVLRQSAEGVKWVVDNGTYHNELNELKKQNEIDVDQAYNKGKGEGKTAGENTGKTAGINEEKAKHWLSGKGLEAGVTTASFLLGLGGGGFLTKTLLDKKGQQPGLKDTMMKKHEEKVVQNKNKAMEKGKIITK